MENKIARVGELLDAFKFKGALENVEQLFNGHINDTYVFTFKEENGRIKKYLVQTLNAYVFKDPDALMKNVVGVTDYMRKIVKRDGGDPDRECLYVLFTKDGEPYYVDSDGLRWRCYNYICGAHSENAVKSEEMFYNAARAFGKFQRALADYPDKKQKESI